MTDIAHFPPARVIPYIGITLCCVFLFVAALLFLTKDGKSNQTQIDPFHSCINDARQDVKTDILIVETYISLWNLCDRQIYDTLIYDDFAIRREKFRRQELDERVNLWLVVAITLSGVTLSGVQLIMSFRIAMSGKEYWANDTAFAIEQGRISFKSSITGLAILALSLAFFVVYVRWIYADREIGAPMASPTPITLGHQLPQGSFTGPATRLEANSPGFSNVQSSK
jgi:hypothetical protein